MKSYDFVPDGNGGTKVKYDKFANQLIQDKFWYWMKKKNCSITKDQSLREMNDLIITTVANAGECFIKHLKGPAYGKWGYKIQILIRA